MAILFVFGLIVIGIILVVGLLVRQPLRSDPRPSRPADGVGRFGGGRGVPTLVR